VGGIDAGHRRQVDAVGERGLDDARDFSFTVGRDGQLRGFATAAYQPTFDTDKLNALVSYAKGATASALGAAGVFGALAAPQINLIVGVKIDYPDPMPVRRGPIPGSVRNGTISINWAGPDKDDGVPFTAILANLKKDQRLTSGRLAIPAPFARDAQVTGGRLAVAQGGVKSEDEGVTFESRTYWSAYKIGPWGLRVAGRAPRSTSQRRACRAAPPSGGPASQHL